MHDQIIGDYHLIREIGSGALGTVFLAEHQFIKKKYALKILSQELCRDSQFLNRFQDEVAKLANLDHPHIVKIHNVSCSQGVYFLVTDCILNSLGDAMNLAQHMARRKEPLREEELLKGMKQLASALDHAHQKGLVHNSLKLNNILISKSDWGIDFFISDFGLTKIISAPKAIMHNFYAVAEALGNLSPTCEASGTRYFPSLLDADQQSQLIQSFLQGFAFLAPEQKNSEETGVAADIYAFGVLAYYLISGKFPEGIFPMPSQLATEYRYDWDSLVIQCLHQDPDLRPRQLLPLLERKKSDKPSVALTPSQLDLLLNHESLEKFNQSIEPLKEAAVRIPMPQQVIREQTQVKGLFDRSVEEISLLPSSIVGVSQVETGSSTKELRSSPVFEAEDAYHQQLAAMLNRDPVVTHYSPEKHEIKSIEPFQTEMVVIKGGQFMRGSNGGHRDEMPAHKIAILSFSIDIHPVTNEQFVRFLDYMGGEKDQHHNDLIRLKDSRISRSSGKLSIEPGYAKHPVVGVTWYGASGYSKWIGKRLPYESEWEIAAYGGLTHALYPTGEQIEKNQANFFSSDTTAVMSYPPNGYGLYDMVGNVYEWCQDWYGYNYYEISANEPDNPRGPLQGVYRVLRGGCWKSLSEDMRCSHRHRNNPGTVNSTYGFRCAADVH